MGSGQELYKKARRLIPGGTQLLSKRPELFLPDQWPAYYRRAKGAEVWDLDGRPYLDATHCGVGAPILGYADDEVDAAVTAAVQAGSATTLNCPEEIELAELLIELHPWAQMVRYARGGGEVMAMAVRIARAAAGRDKIAFCGYHGWQDWYLAANLHEEGALEDHLLPGLEPAGVPRGLAGSVLPFRYNQIDELRAIVDAQGDDLAAIVMEPARDSGPDSGFLEEIRELASRVGAVLVFDEVTSGWRMNTGGIHLQYGIAPDMAVFAKALANGYPMAAIVGVHEVMEAAQKTFISSTVWTEKIGPAAALATIGKHRRESVPVHLVATGERVQKAWREAADRAGFAVHASGIPPLSHLSFEGEDALGLNTLFIQEMLDRGILASTSFYANFAHGADHIDRYEQALDEVFPILARANESGDARAFLRGPLRHTGFARLT